MSHDLAHPCSTSSTPRRTNDHPRPPGRAPMHRFMCEIELPVSHATHIERPPPNARLLRSGWLDNLKPSQPQSAIPRPTREKATFASRLRFKWSGGRVGRARSSTHHPGLRNIAPRADRLPPTARRPMHVETRIFLTACPIWKCLCLSLRCSLCLDA